MSRNAFLTSSQARIRLTDTGCAPKSKSVERHGALRHYAPLIVIVVLAIPWCAWNLGDQCLWQDEAQTACISETVLTHGIPLGCDGKNSFSQAGGTEWGRGYVWWFHGWVQFYLTAASMLLLGHTTLAARLPFALCGVATVVVTYLYASFLWRTRRAGVVAAIMLLLCVPFLLLARQSRYYVCDALFSMLCLYSYHLMLARSRRASIVFVASAVLLFHSYYLAYPALLAPVLLHSAVFRRDRLKALLIATAASLVFVLPWMVLLWRQSSVFTAGEASPHFVASLGDLLRSTLRYAVPWQVLLVFPLAALLRWAKRSPAAQSGVPWSDVGLLLFFCGVTVVSAAYCFAVPHFRYLASILPVICVLTALAIEYAMQRHFAFGPLILAGLFATWPVTDYAYELTHHYEGPIDGIVRFLGTHAKPTDIVAMSYGDMPVRFYNHLRVVGGYSSEGLAEAEHADYIIPRHYVLSPGMRAFNKKLLGYASNGRYRRIIIASPDLAFENREDLAWHQFRTAKDQPFVDIYQRIE